MSNNNSVITPEQHKKFEDKFLSIIPRPDAFEHTNTDHRNMVRVATALGCIPDKFFKREEYRKADKSLTDTAFLSWINFLDLSDRLLSTFAYIPEKDSKGQPFVGMVDNIGDGMIMPITDAKGQVVYRGNGMDDAAELEARLSCQPQMVRLKSIAIPAVLDNGFSYGQGSVNGQGEGYDSTIGSDAITDRTRSKKIGRVNPTYSFVLKQQLRQYVSDRGNPVRATREFITVILKPFQPAVEDKFGRIIIDAIPAIEERYMVEYGVGFTLRLSANAFNHYKNTMSSLGQSNVSPELVELNMMADELVNSNRPEDKQRLNEILSMLKGKSPRPAQTVEEVIPEANTNVFADEVIKDMKEGVVVDTEVVDSTTKKPKK